jgi:thiol-disulfide isomerase/thioredoxin
LTKYLDVFGVRSYKTGMKYWLTVLLLFPLCGGLLWGAPPAASRLMKEARSKAKAEKKPVFVHFVASWCPWCKRMDALLARAEVVEVFQKYFISVRLDVAEKKKKELENPGADKVLKAMGGPGGLPFCAVTNVKGKLLANSKVDGDNFGYPSTPEEIATFLKILKTAAPDMAATDLVTLEMAIKASLQANQLSPASAPAHSPSA